MQLSEYKNSVKSFAVHSFVKTILTCMHSVIKVQSKSIKSDHKNNASYLSKHEEQMIRNKVMMDYEQIRAGLINRY
ncbi:hypothetical protein ACFQ3N_07445 [Virgibacillus byunsanensis]|uniref:Transposase n=1 Tax=Virgibacillus byunsanensis TaxID=570945 RepID=A0ABW3LIM7_9BACI